NIDDTVGDLDDIPNLDDEIKETEETNNNEEQNNEEDNNENVPEMKEYSDEELLDSDNILDDDNEEDLNDIPDSNDEIKESEEDDNEELEETVDDNNNNSSDNDIIKGIDDIIDDDDNKEGDILISHGSILEDEIVKKEEEYFSSSDAFNFSLNRDFLLGDYDDEENDSNNKSSNISPNFNEEYDDGEVIKPASEKDTFDTEDLIDKDLYDPEEVPKVPDDFYREAEEKVKENMTSNWKKVLKALRGKKFVNKNMADMLEWVKEQSGLDIIHAAMLSRQDNGSYDIVESQNISDNTKDKLNISENEALFKKILSHKKTLYVSDPFASDSIKSKFDPEDRKDISHMIFVPIENDEGGLKSFFIGLSSN
ncbi:AAA family ATPase, partial [Brachyspira intermedia]